MRRETAGTRGSSDRPAHPSDSNAAKPMSRPRFATARYASHQGEFMGSPRAGELFGRLGVTNIRTFVDPERPTRVGVLPETPVMLIER
jgi:hypothetical protein